MPKPKKSVILGLMSKELSINGLEVRAIASRLIAEQSQGRTGTNLGIIQAGMEYKTLAATSRAQGDKTRADLYQEIGQNLMFVGSHEYPPIGTCIGTYI